MTMYMYRSLLNTCTFSSARLGVLFPSNCLCTSLANTCAIPHLSNSATNRNTCSRNRSSHNNNRGAKFKCPIMSRDWLFQLCLVRWKKDILSICPIRHITADVNSQKSFCLWEIPQEWIWKGTVRGQSNVNHIWSGERRDSSHSASWCSLLFNFGEKSSLASYHRSPTERSKRRSLWEIFPGIISNPQCKHGGFLTQPLEINFGLVEINLGL